VAKILQQITIAGGVSTRRVARSFLRKKLHSAEVFWLVKKNAEITSQLLIDECMVTALINF
jgi:hypothetical protein